jgi:hypothetical protein
MAKRVSLPPILPKPRRCRALEGYFRLRDGLPITLSPASTDRDLVAARALAAAARLRCGVHLAIETHARTRDLGARIELERGGEAGDAYRLRVDPGRIVLVGTGAAGLRYAVETLRQLLGPDGRIPACSIQDEPDLRLRGLMLDISRGKVPRPETLRKIVDLCVSLKLNLLMLYTEHTFHFRRHPEIGAGASPLDAQTLRELDAYAAERHVDLVPTLQSLGHMERLLGLERYRHLDESGRGWTLSPSEAGTYELLGDLYDEYLPNFRSRWFNANCDEPWDLAQGKSRQRAEQVGVAGVYLEHVRRVRDLARAHGKRTMIWGDVVHQHPDRIGEIDRDLVLLDWWYEAELDYDRVQSFRDAGLEFLVCPGTSSWNALFPRLENSLSNVARWAAAARRHGGLGLVCTDWGDGGHYNLQGNSWLAFAWAAQQAWSGDVPAGDFDRAFGRVLFADASGAAARCYRALGAVHDVGLHVFNASPLQLLYFDDFERAFFLQGTRPAALRRALRRLERARARIEAARGAFGEDTLTWQELHYAAEASLHAVRKSLAAHPWLAWRREPKRLDGRDRRRLASELEGLGAAQAALTRRLRKLWLERSQISEFALTQRRAEASARSLRRAARALARNAPPQPPPVAEDYSPPRVLAEVRASLGR